MTYDEVDKLLFQLVDGRKAKEDVLALGFPKNIVEKVLKLIKASEFKRSLPPIAKLSHRTVGVDFLYPHDREV